MVTAEFAKFAGILNAALPQHHLLGYLHLFEYLLSNFSPLKILPMYLTTSLIISLEHIHILLIL